MNNREKIARKLSRVRQAHALRAADPALTAKAIAQQLGVNRATAAAYLAHDLATWTGGLNMRTARRTRSWGRRRTLDRYQAIHDAFRHDPAATAQTIGTAVGCNPHTVRRALSRSMGEWRTLAKRAQNLSGIPWGPKDPLRQRRTEARLAEIAESHRWAELNPGMTQWEIARAVGRRLGRVGRELQYTPAQWRWRLERRRRFKPAKGNGTWRRFPSLQALGLPPGARLTFTRKHGVACTVAAGDDDDDNGNAVTYDGETMRLGAATQRAGATLRQPPNYRMKPADVWKYRGQTLRTIARARGLAPAAPPRPSRNRRNP